MKTFNRKTGRIGEDIAVKYLADKGYEIVKRNFSNKFGEIDVIAKYKDVLVFVEVKTKKGDEFGMPEEMVGRGKLRKVKNMATIYLQGRDVPCRIDVIAVVLSGEDGVNRVTHYENVY